MNRAEQAKLALTQNRMTWGDLLIEAEEIAEAFEQDYENEITLFEYIDGSVAAFHGIGQEIYTYAAKS